MPRSNWATGPPPTKIVCLAGLEVPRIGRRDTPDEPFAFGAREFLRKKVIGKRVSFRIEYVVPGGTRELGVVKLGEESLAEAVVGAGWAKLRESKGTPDPVLKGLADAAEAAKIGIWELVGLPALPARLCASRRPGSDWRRVLLRAAHAAERGARAEDHRERGGPRDPGARGARLP